MVNNDCGILADGIFGVPVQGSNMKGLSVDSGFVPDSRNSAGSFDEFWENVKPLHFSGYSFVDCLSNTLDLFNVSGVGVSLGDSNVDVQNFAKKLFGSSDDWLDYEFREFFLEYGFDLTSIIGVE